MEKIIDDLKWLKAWLEQPPVVDWGKNYECAESIGKAIDILEKVEKLQDDLK